MVSRKLTAVLLITTALSSVSMAQTAQQPAAETPPAAAPATPASPTTAPAVAAPTSAQVPTAPAAAATAPAAKAAAPATPAPPKPAAQAAPAAAKPAAAQQTTSFGTVSVPEPPKPQQNVALPQTGLTASPTDFAAVKDQASRASSATTAGGVVTTGTGAPGTTIGAGRGVSLGGVTGQDVGGGYMIQEVAPKSRSTVTRDAIDKQAPTANPYQLINLLPGIVQSSTDNAGLNGGNVRIRGFNSDHIGFTIEGMPVPDSGNYALYPQEYVDAENVGQISVSQGSPELDSPHIGATGGVINLYAIDPDKKMGALVDYSFGSNGLSREFVRLNSGQVGAVRAFLSYSRLDQDHWGDNPGTDRRNHLDFKMVADISPGNTVRFTAIYNDALNNFYPNPTLAQFKSNSGFRYTTTGKGTSTNYYDYRVNPFKNLILSAPSNFTLSEKLKFDTIPYFWYGFGNGGGVFNLNESTGMYWGNLKITGADWNKNGKTDSALYYNPSITETKRPGVINKFTWTEGNHQIVAGHWFEYAMHRQTGGYTPLAADGGVQDYFGDTNNIAIPSTAKCQQYNTATKSLVTVPCPTGSSPQKRDTNTKTMTNMIFVGDSWKFAPNWTADFGLRQVFADREVDDNMPFAPTSRRELHDTATLPTVGLKYKWDEANQFFGSINTSIRSAPNFTMTPNYSSNPQSNGNPAAANTFSPLVPDPEKGIVYELGHRYQGQLLQTSLTGFVGRYENFQQSTNILDPNTGTNYSATINVGGLMNYGVDAEIGTRPIYNFRPYVGAEWLHTELLDNMPTVVAGKVDYLRTKGKQLVGAPEYQFGLGLDYDDGHLFANVAYKYLGEQYSTFMNDEKIDAYGRMDASIGYRFDDIAQLKKPEMKISFFNVLNSRDLTGVNSFANNAKSTTTVNGNTVAASGTPNYYLGQDFSFMVTLRAGL